MLPLRRCWITLLVLLLGFGNTPVRAEERPIVAQALQTAATTLNAATTIGPGFMSRCRETAIYIEWSAASSAGAVVVESAFNEAYAGTWANLATVNWVSGSRVDIVQITGVHGALRTRVSSAITGGTVNTWIACN